MFWQGKTVLITGHTGFKGSWLSLWLSYLGAKVYGFALAPEHVPNLYECASVESVLDSTINDIRNPVAVKDCVSTVRPDIIFHLAAQAIVRESYSQPSNTIEVNVMGTVNILEAARFVDSVKSVVVVTSDKCYENKEWQRGYRENEALGGHDPYSASKACAELIAQAWRLSFMENQLVTGANTYALATARAGNVIGGGDWSQDRLIPDIIQAIEKSNTVFLRNPNAIRPWPMAWSSAWNFGPADTDSKPVWWITEKLIKQFGVSAQWTTDTELHPQEAKYLKLDCAKARETLKWSSVWELQRCLEEIVHWHKAFGASENMKDTSIATIERYMRELSQRREHLAST